MTTYNRLSAGEAEINKMKDKEKRAESGKGMVLTGPKQLKFTAPGKGNTGDMLEGNKKRKIQTQKEENTNARTQERRRQKGEKEKKTSKKRVKEEEINAIQLTARKYDLLEAMLDSSISCLKDNEKAVLTEVEVKQSSMDQKECREDQERKKDQAKYFCAPQMDKESIKEMENKSVSKKEEREEENGIDSDEHVVWVQCSRFDCGKWRKLSEDVDPSVLPDDWTCENNSDPAVRSCSVSEEQSSMCVEEIFFSSFVPGSLVWAQESQHLWWPAMIEKNPDTDDYVKFNKKTDTAPEKYHVTYFGDPLYIDWVLCSNVKNFADLSEEDVFSMLEQQELLQNLKEAVGMSKQAQKLPLQMRLIRFGVWSRYDSDRECSEEDSDITKVFGLFRGKSGKYSDDEYVLPKTHKRWLKEGEGKQLKKRGHKKESKETSAEKRKKKSERENGKSVKKEENKVGDDSEKDPLKVTKQKDAGRQKIQDQTVPQTVVKKTSDSRCSKGDVKVREDEGNDCRREEKQSGQKLRRWVDDFSDEEEVFPSDEEDGNNFLDTDMNILGCMKMSCIDDVEEEEDEEEDKQDDFCLMLLEEEES